MRYSKQNGSILVLFAVCFVFLSMFIALATNVGLVFANKAKLKAAVDAAALAGAQQLGDGKGTAAATDAAIKYAKLNLTGSNAVVTPADITFSDNNDAITVSITERLPLILGKLIGLPTLPISVSSSAQLSNNVVLSPKWSAPAPPLAIFSSYITDVPAQLKNSSHSELYAMVTEPTLWLACHNYLANGGSEANLYRVVANWARNTPEGKKYLWRNGDYEKFAAFIYQNLVTNPIDQRIDINHIFCYCNILFPGDKNTYSDNLIYGYQGTCSTDTGISYMSGATGSLEAVEDEITRMDNDSNTDVNKIQLGQNRLRTYPVISNDPDNLKKGSHLKIDGFAAFWLKNVLRGPIVHKRSDRDGDFCPASIDYGYFVKMTLPGAGMYQPAARPANNYGTSSIKLLN